MRISILLCRQLLLNVLLDFLQVRRQHYKLGLYRSLDSQVLLIGLSVTKLGFEILPLLPEFLAVISRVSKLTDVHENGSGTIDFTHVRLNFCVLPTYLDYLLFSKFLEGCFENSPRFGNAKQLRNFGDIDVEGLESLLFGEVVDHPVVDLNGMRV